MAGSYADVPGRRMAWDADGTVALSTPGSTTEPLGPWDELTTQDRSDLNSEELGNYSVGGSNQPGWLAWMFPELREVDGWYGNLATANGSDHTLETSADTTNGIDGTWTSRSTSSSLWSVSEAMDDYRTGIVSLAANAVRGVRIVGRAGGVGRILDKVRSCHLYGEISPGETPDRLLWIDETTGLEFDGAQDYGDVPRGSARDIEVRLKNNSASLTATTIQYTAEDLSYGSGGWYTFTTPGGSSFSATQQIASLGAGATSGLIKVRQIVPDAAQLGVHAARAYTDVTSWS